MRRLGRHFDLQNHPCPPVNDALSVHNVGAGRWGDPSYPDTDSPAELPLSTFDYSAGVLVGVPVQEADALAQVESPHFLRVRTDLDLRSYQVPHESTHRRYEPPKVVPVNQAAAGFTLIEPPTNGLHYIKVLGCFLTLDAAGTLRFVQGDAFGNSNAPLTGNMALGGASNADLELGTVDPPNPHLFTSPDQALGIFTVTGKAQGWVVVCISPYDQ